MNKVTNLSLIRRREGSKKERETETDISNPAVNADKYDCFCSTETEASFGYCSFFLTITICRWIAFASLLIGFHSNSKKGSN